MPVEALPEEPSQITPAWLTAAFQRRHPGAEVRALRVLEVHHGTNSNARVAVDFAAGDGLPSTYFLKLPPLDPARREQIKATGMGRREALFYRDLVDHVPLHTARPYVAELDEATGAFVLLIEDLEPTAASLPDPVGCLDPRHAERAMADFAQLHVRYEDAAARAREAGWVEAMPRGTDFGPSMLAIGLEHHRDKLTDAFAEMAQLYIDQQAAFEDVWERGPVTVLQGDSHIGNLFVDGDRVGFLDWGLVQLGHPMRDVGYFITQALTPQNRRTHERALIERYLDERAKVGGAAMSFDEAWLAHRVHASYAAPAACPLVLFRPGETPAERRTHDAFLDRSSQVIADLDARGALRDVAGI